MGGKGRRRREKNYRAAHGRNNRLPPPPNPSSLDALPSKLRKLMSLNAASGAGKASSESVEKNKGRAGNVTNKTRPSKDVDSKVNVLKGEGDDANLMAQHIDLGGGASPDITSEKKKKKRKRNKVNDLRFEGTEEVVGSGSKRKERKKQRLEERKKKHKKGRAADDVDFPGHEEIKFGDVVEAPPKLVAVPKPLKNTPDASLERLRLRAVEEYRKRKGWTSRPGVQLPPPATASPML